jgi:RNA polymerase sigma-70 factor (ECF subfamily)
MSSVSSEQSCPPAGPRRNAEPPAGAGGLDFDAVYDHFDFVWRNMGRLGVEPAAVEDATQDVFVVVLRRLADFESRSSIRTWLFGIALRVAHDYRRAARRRRNHGIVAGDEGDADGVADAEAPSPLDSATRTEAVARLHAILAELDEERRAVFILAELEQMSAPDIAEATGTNLNTVYTRLRAARREFNEAVARTHARDAWRQP